MEIKRLPTAFATETDGEYIHRINIDYDFVLFQKGLDLLNEKISKINELLEERKISVDEEAAVSVFKAFSDFNYKFGTEIPEHLYFKIMKIKGIVGGNSEMGNRYKMYLPYHSKFAYPDFKYSKRTDRHAPWVEVITRFNSITVKTHSSMPQHNWTNVDEYTLSLKKGWGKSSRSKQSKQ